MAILSHSPLRLVFATFFLFATLACNTEDSIVLTNDDEENQNQNQEDPNQNQNQEDPNQNQEDPDLVGASLFTNCAAGGVATGGGYKLVHCTGPAEAGGQELTGSDFTLQAGPFRQIAQ